MPTRASTAIASLGGAGSLLVGFALVAPEHLDPSATRALVGIAGAVVLLAGGFVGWLLQERERQVASATRSIRRVLAGDLHEFLPVPRDDSFGDLSNVINELVDAVRTNRLLATADRMVDEAMVRETPNGLLIVDENGKVRRYNPGLARVLPLRLDPLGRLPIEAIPVPELQEVIDEARRTREPSERVATVAGREVLMRGVPLADGATCMGVVLDISSVRAAERARRDFVANVSHELRTPITALVGYAESLLQDKDELPPWARPMVEALDRNARRLSALIEDVLHLSKIEARKGDLPLASEPVRALVEEVAGRFEERARQKGVALEVREGPDAEASINADALEHAIANLVDNAVKYTPAGGRIEVRVEPREKDVWIVVADTGIGVAPEHQERIFERFYRVDPGRSRDVGGTGLGLALVKHLSLAMHAEITLVSEPGKGTTFTLKLPR